MRTYETTRKTAETDISLTLNLDGTGKSSIDTGCGFLNHMLTLFASHGRFDLTVKCAGDVDVDDHHSVEDIGIVLGQAVKDALGDKLGAGAALPCKCIPVSCVNLIYGNALLQQSLRNGT